MKKVLSILTAIFIGASMLGIPVVADSSDFTYAVLDDGTAEITAYSGSDVDLEIPKTLSGYAVSSIGEYCFFGKNTIESISFPTSVTTIKKGAFLQCTAIKSILIPGNITDICEDAFKYCTSAFKVTFESGVKSIGKSAFSDCSSLFLVEADKSVESVGLNAFANTLWINNRPNGVVYVGSVAYDYFGSMPENCRISIENGTKSIAEQFCYGETKLFALIIPTSVKTIGDSAFAYCSNLALLRLNNGIETINSYAFYNCSSLKKVYIPTATNSIADNTFAGTSNLVVSSYNNSYVQGYCTKNSLEFVALDKEILVGDIDGNGKINMKDTLALSRYHADWPISIDASNSDTYFDEVVNIKDVFMLRRFLSEAISVL